MIGLDYFYINVYIYNIYIYCKKGAVTCIHVRAIREALSPIFCNISKISYIKNDSFTSFYIIVIFIFFS